MLEGKILCDPEQEAPYIFKKLGEEEKIKRTLWPTLLYVDSGEMMVYDQEQEVDLPLKKWILRHGTGIIMPEVQRNYLWRMSQGCRAFSLELLSSGDFLQRTTEETDIPLERVTALGNKRVTKPWGYEQWLAHLPNHGALKILHVKKRKELSLQVHRKKHETSYVLKGEVDVLRGLHVDPQTREEELRRQVTVTDLAPYWQRKYMAQYWTVQPGEVHRMRAVRDTWILEASTPELDDVIRLQDNYQRPSGRIEKEHEISK